MSHKTKFTILAILVVCGRLFDVCTTAVYTPDLKHEANPLVYFFGAGWTVLILVQVIITLLLVYGLYYYFFQFRSIEPEERGLNLREYISYFCFSNKHSFTKVFYETPTNRSGLVAISVYVTTMTLIFFSFLVGTSTVFLIISPAYKQIYKHGLPLVMMGFVFPSIAYFSLQFFRMEYEKYKLAQSNL